MVPTVSDYARISRQVTEALGSLCQRVAPPDQTFPCGSFSFPMPALSIAGHQGANDGTR